MNFDRVFEALQRSVEGTFGMIGSEVQVNHLDSIDGARASHSTVASIGLGGTETEAALNLLLPNTSAVHIVKRMLCEDEVDRDMIHDGMGEVANLVAGGIKSQMPDQGIDLTVGLPSVVTGDRIPLSYSSAASVHPFQFIVDSAHVVDGMFLIREKKRHGAAAAARSRAGETA